MSPAVAVREIPIPFSAPMVRAVLGERKTQTRRVIAKAPIEADSYVLAADGTGEVKFFSATGSVSLALSKWLHCPYGRPGDRLWVREPIRRAGDRVEYVADGAVHPDAEWVWKIPYLAGRYMPRGLCRHWLEVTDVRVERLQEISDADAISEGAYRFEGTGGTWWKMLGDQEDGYGHPRDAFTHLWNRLNAARGHGWEVNPWVWVVSFRRWRPHSMLRAHMAFERMFPNAHPREGYGV